VPFKEQPQLLEARVRLVWALPEVTVVKSTASGVGCIVTLGTRC